MTVVNNRPDTKLDLRSSHARYNKFSPFSCSSSLFVQQLLLWLIERSLVLGHGPLPRGIRVLYLTITNEPAYLPGSKHHRVESGYKRFFVFTKLLSTTNALAPMTLYLCGRWLAPIIYRSTPVIGDMQIH